MKHFIFYDDTCGLCQKCKQKVLKIDHQKIFTFVPLSENLPEKVSSFKSKNTLILLENYQTPKEKVWIRAKAVFRIFYLLGGKYKMVGVFCFLPSFVVDPFYRFIAHYRKMK